jgi:hypothetical protein
MAKFSDHSAASSSTGDEAAMKLRQGSILPKEVRDRLGLSAVEDNTDPVIIVISHDCDLVKSQEVEPKVELLHGRTRNELKPGLPYGQSPHLLHIKFVQNGEKKVLELCALNKVTRAKSELIKVDPDPNSILEPNGVDILQGWLAARYKRAAFPDDLNARLMPMKRKLHSVGSSNPASIVGVWMKYSPDENRLNDKVPYELWVKIVYSTLVFDAKAKAEHEAEKLRASFEKLFLDGDLWRSIDLQTCEAIPDTAFTVRDLFCYKQWRLEHLSLSQDPPEKYI